jgi:predicted kinase
MKNVVILIGVPGSGKSFLAESMSNQALKSNLSVSICSSDTYMVNENGEYDFNYKKLKYVHEECFKRFSQSLREGINLVICDNTNILISKRRPYKELARKMGYLIQEIYIQSDFNNVRGIPEETVSKMRLKLEFEKKI